MRVWVGLNWFSIGSSRMVEMRNACKMLVAAVEGGDAFLVVVGFYVRIILKWIVHCEVSE